MTSLPGARSVDRRTSEGAPQGTAASGAIGGFGIRLVGPHRLGLISAILILSGLLTAQAARARITARETAGLTRRQPGAD